MGFSNQERINLNSKVLAASVKDANEVGQWYESFFPNKFAITDDKVWSGADLETLLASPAPNVATAQANAAANPTVIEDLSALSSGIRMTEVPGSNGSTYVAFSIYNDLTSNRVDNWIQPQLVSRSDFGFEGFPSIGYAIRLFNGDPDSGGTEIFTSDGQTGTGETATVGWVFDYANGMLLLSSDFRSTVTDPWIVGFRYIGTTVKDTFNFGQQQESIPVTFLGQTNFTLSSLPIADGYVQMFVNGVKQENDVEYIQTGNTVQYTGALTLDVSDVIEFWYLANVDPAACITASQDLAQTLAVGNITDGYDIDLTNNSVITSSDGYIELDGSVNISQNLYVAGKLTVDGLIDPTGLVLSEQVIAPYSPQGAGGLEGVVWVRNDGYLIFTSQNDDDFVLGQGGEETLAETLAFGNTTNGNDIVISLGDSIIINSSGDDPPNGIIAPEGDDLTIRIESGTAEGGDFRVYAGNSTAGNPAGYVYINGGNANSDYGGDVNLNGGSSNNSYAGYINLIGGNGVATGSYGGNINLNAGNGFISDSSDGGHININAGDNSAGVSTIGGRISLNGGAGSNIGGHLTLSGGIGTSLGGDVEFRAGEGTSGTGGYIELSAGEGSSTGGNVEIAAGRGGTTNGIIRFRTDGNDTGDGGWLNGITRMVIADSVINMSTDVTLLSGNNFTINNGDINVSGDGYISGNFEVGEGLIFNEQLTAPYDPSITGTEGLLWVRNDEQIIFTNQSGIDTVLGGGSGGIGPNTLTVTSTTQTTQTTGWTVISAFEFDPTEYDGYSNIEFRALIETTNASDAAQIRIYNLDTSSEVPGSLLSTTSISTDLVSVDITDVIDISSSIYEVQISLATTGSPNTCICKRAEIRIT